MNWFSALPIFTIGLLFNCCDARALSLEFDYEFEKKTTEEAILGWGDDVLATLPPSLHERVPGKIRVRFRSWGQANQLTQPYCASEASEENTADGPLFESYGRYNALRNIIYINSRLLPEILLGPSGTRSFDCYHGNFYRLAMATLLHEIGHAYDALDLDASVGKSDTQSRLSSTTISSDPSWTVLDGFHTRFLGFRYPMKKNRDLDRLPSAHAASNKRESFAVHFEYFLLDADYSCRFPSHQEYFENHFGWTPDGGDCTATYEVVSQQSPGLVTLNPERVYQVRYLMAAPGQKAETRFGHTMLHFVLCAPGTALGPECLEQEEEDIVLGFAARTDDSPWRWLKGMLGSYDSMVFFTSLQYQLQIYNQFETRDVVSHPIDLNREQIRRLSLRAIELYWTYRGPYRIFSINCATETEDLLKAGILSEDYIYGTRRTPRGVLKRLRESGLLLETEASLFYKSDFDLTSRALTDLYDAPQVRRRKSLHRRIGKLSIDERRGALDRLESELASVVRFAEDLPHAESLEQTMRDIITLGQRLESFRLLEENIARQQNKKLAYASIKELKRLARRSETMTELLERFRYLMLAMQAGDRDSRPGYGIPLRREHGPDRVELSRELDALSSQILSLDFQSARFSRWQEETSWSNSLAENRYRVLRSYADVAREVRIEIMNRTVAQFPDKPNSAVRLMLERQFGSGSFELTRISDARINMLREKTKSTPTITAVLDAPL
ncbi:MAG: DUF4105 domain-containing protein [Gammaproteobacteria bacterium]|nr:DUF4105 domain-containing protein [Gammaproteobacteria bacterium]